MSRSIRSARLRTALPRAGVAVLCGVGTGQAAAATKLVFCAQDIHAMVQDHAVAAEDCRTGQCAGVNPTGFRAGPGNQRTLNQRKNARCQGKAGMAECASPLKVQ